jgi:hypothetical protein
MCVGDSPIKSLPKTPVSLRIADRQALDSGLQFHRIRRNFDVLDFCFHLVEMRISHYNQIVKGTQGALSRSPPQVVN